MGQIYYQKSNFLQIRENGVEESEAPHIGLYEKTLSLHPQYPSLNDCRLLEVGCGQGGGIDWINRYLVYFSISPFLRIPH